MYLTTLSPALLRRPHIIIAATGLFIFLVVYRQHVTIQEQASRTYTLFGLKHDAGRSQVVQQSWYPAHDWNGLSPVYDNFPSLNDLYAQSTGFLSRKWWQRALAQPYPAYQHGNKGERNVERLVSCMGPRGKRLNESRADTVERYLGKLRIFPEAPIGSNKLVGFETEACYERFGRHTPYGLWPEDGENTTEPQLKWHSVDWGTLQEQCIEENQHRFDMEPRTAFQAAEVGNVEDDRQITTSHKAPRSAVIFRTHQHYEYTPELMRNMRSIIQELALYTSGQYQVFLLVEIKDADIPIWESDEAYDRAVEMYVPPEFRNMTVLWNMYKWHQVYPLIQEDMLNVHMSQWFSVQFFRKLYPEFDYYWNWEMDTRFTGHHYDMVRAVDEFTRAQPRKGMWERNERVYMPRVQGSYQQFMRDVQSRYQSGSTDSSIWGPVFPPDGPSDEQAEWLSQLNIQPPVSNPADDDFSWGVGEPADFLTFLPMFNPSPTNYVYRDNYNNYGEDIPNNELPRRTTIITLARLSSRLLQLMEAENSTPPMHHMSSETWPHSISLHYGLKAIYVPHSIYLEQDWPTLALDWVFNNGDQDWTLTYHPNNENLNQNGEGSGGPESVFGLEREHNWDRSTWYYRNRLAERLYKRWLGWEYDGSGGEEWERINGRYCLPPMLLHPIKALAEPSDYVDGRFVGDGDGDGDGNS